MSRVPSIEDMVDAALDNDGTNAGTEKIASAVEGRLSPEDNMEKVAAELEEWAGITHEKETEEDAGLVQDWKDFQQQRMYKLAMVQTMISTMDSIMDGEDMDKEAFVAKLFGKGVKAVGDVVSGVASTARSAKSGWLKSWEKTRGQYYKGRGTSDPRTAAKATFSGGKPSGSGSAIGYGSSPKTAPAKSKPKSPGSIGYGAPTTKVKPTKPPTQRFSGGEPVDKNWKPISSSKTKSKKTPSKKKPAKAKETKKPEAEAEGGKWVTPVAIGATGVAGVGAGAHLGSRKKQPEQQFRYGR